MPVRNLIGDQEEIKCHKKEALPILKRNAKVKNVICIHVKYVEAPTECKATIYLIPKNRKIHMC